MTHFKKLFFVSCLLTLFTLISGQAFADTTEQNSGKSYLFIQTAKMAVLKPVDAQKGEYSLVMHDVSPYVSYFTDRPDRVTGMVSLDKFLKQWQAPGSNSFQKDAPNAGVAGAKLTSMGKQNSNYVLTLSDPVYDAAKQTVTYKAIATSGKQASELPEKMTVLRNVAVFFDNVNMCWGCGS